MFNALIISSLLVSAMFQNDVITTRSGEELRIGFLGHGSLVLEFEGKIIYVDPVGMFADYSKAPKADLIFVTHQHDDHLDPVLIDSLQKKETVIIGPQAVVDELGKGFVMHNGDEYNVADYLSVEAIPAYNTTPGHEGFHPHTGRDNGYLLTLGGSRIYISGDSEPTLEMLALRDLDVVFLPVNQPYTMTVDQAVSVVKTLQPTIFYPYHTGQTDQKTDLKRLVKELKGSGVDVRIRSME